MTATTNHAKTKIEIKALENCSKHFTRFVVEEFNNFCEFNKIDPTDLDNLIKYCIQFNLFKDSTLRQYTSAKLYQHGYYIAKNCELLAADIDAEINYSKRNTLKAVSSKKFVQRKDISLFKS